MTGGAATQEERATLLRFVERFALFLRESGMAPMPARVFAYALADDADRYTAAELADGLQVSPAAISGAVRQLVQIGFLVREREPGTRSDLYVLDDANLWTRFTGAELASLERMEDIVTAGIDLLGPDRPGGRRLAETREFLAFLHEVLADAIARWPEERIRRAVPPAAG